MAFVTSVTGAQLYYCLCCCNFAHHSIVARSNFFWLFVTKMRGRRDDDVRLRRFLSANAAGAKSGGHPEVVK